MDQALSTKEIKVARQYLSPNTRAEVDRALSLKMPLHPSLEGLIREILRGYQERVTHVSTITK